MSLLLLFGAGGTPGSFATSEGSASASGGSSPSLGAALLATLEGNAAASGGSSAYVGAGGFSTLGGFGSAAGGDCRMRGTRIINGAFYSTTLSLSTHTVTVPAGVTADMVALFAIGTADQIVLTMSATTSGSGSVTQLEVMNATNTRIGLFKGTGLVAGDTVSIIFSTSKPAAIGHQYRNDVASIDSFSSAIRGANVATSVTGSFTPTAGQLAWLVAIDRTLVGPSLSGVTSSGGETVRVLDYNHVAASTVPHVGVAFADMVANSAAARTATFTYSSGSTNGYAAGLLVTQRVFGVFETYAGSGEAAGGSSSFTGSSTPGTFSSSEGTATAAGGTSSFGTPVVFATTGGSASASGGTGSLAAGAVFGTAGATATASGGSSTLHGNVTPVEALLALSPFYVAHRGGSADWVEETAYAYDQAAAWSASLALEVSVWRSSDGVWVCSHDQTTGRVFGTNYDIPSTSWATLSTLTTTVGGYPILRLVDLLNTHAVGNRALFVDNKGNTNASSLFDLLDTYGGPSRFVSKGFITSVATANTARSRGYRTWGYCYDADIAVNLPANAASWDLLGMDYAGTAPNWATIIGYGKPVIGHIVANSTQAATALGYGAAGLMVSGVTSVVPHSTMNTASGSSAASGGSSSFGVGGTIATATGVAAASGGSTAATGQGYFGTSGASAAAAGGSTSFLSSSNFATATGSATAAGGSTAGTGQGYFGTSGASAATSGGSTTATGQGYFGTNSASAAAAGGSTSFLSSSNFTSSTGAAAASGGSSTATGQAYFGTSGASAAASGGSTSFIASSNFVTAASGASASGGSTTFAAGATIATSGASAAASGGGATFSGGATMATAGAGAAAGGGSTSFATAGTFTTSAGSAALSGVSSSFTGAGALGGTTAGCAASGSSATFLGAARLVTASGGATAAGDAGTARGAATLSTGSGESAAGGGLAALAGSGAFATLEGMAAADGADSTLQGDVILYPLVRAASVAVRSRGGTLAVRPRGGSLVVRSRPGSIHIRDTQEGR